MHVFTEFNGWNYDSALFDATFVFTVILAVLAAGAPESAAFMADESLKALPGAYPTDYSMKSYTSYNQRVLDCVQKLNNAGTGYRPLIRLRGRKYP